MGGEGSREEKWNQQQIRSSRSRMQLDPFISPIRSLLLRSALQCSRGERVDEWSGLRARFNQAILDLSCASEWTGLGRCVNPWRRERSSNSGWRRTGAAHHRCWLPNSDALNGEPRDNTTGLRHTRAERITQIGARARQSQERGRTTHGRTDGRTGQAATRKETSTRHRRALDSARGGRWTRAHGTYAG